MDRHRSRQMRNHSGRDCATKRTSRDHSRSDSHSYRSSKTRDTRKPTPRCRKSPSPFVRRHSPHRRESRQPRRPKSPSPFVRRHSPPERESYQPLQSISSQYQSSTLERVARRTSSFSTEEMSQSGSYYSREASDMRWSGDSFLRGSPVRRSQSPPSRRYLQENPLPRSYSPVHRRSSSPPFARDSSSKRRFSPSMRRNSSQRQRSPARRQASPSPLIRRDSPSRSPLLGRYSPMRASSPFVSWNSPPEQRIPSPSRTMLLLERNSPVRAMENFVHGDSPLRQWSPSSNGMRYTSRSRSPSPFLRRNSHAGRESTEILKYKDKSDVRRSPSPFQRRQSRRELAERQQSTTFLERTSAMGRTSFEGENQLETEEDDILFGSSVKADSRGRLWTKHYLAKKKKVTAKQAEEQLQKMSAKTNNSKAKKIRGQQRGSIRARARTLKWELGQLKKDGVLPRLIITRKVQPKASSAVPYDIEEAVDSKIQQLSESINSLYDDSSNQGLKLERNYETLGLNWVPEDIEPDIQRQRYINMEGNRSLHSDYSPIMEEKRHSNPAGYVGSICFDGGDDNEFPVSQPLRSNSYDDIQRLPDLSFALPGRAMTRDFHVAADLEDNFAPVDTTLQAILGNTLDVQPSSEPFIQKSNRDSTCMVAGCYTETKPLRYHVLNHLPPCFDDRRVDDLAVLQVQAALLWLGRAIIPLGKDLQALVDVVNGSKQLKDYPIRKQSVLRMTEICRRFNVTVPSKFQMYPINSVAVLTHWRVAGLLLNFLSASKRGEFMQRFGFPTALENHSDREDDTEEEEDREKAPSNPDMYSRAHFADDFVTTPLRSRDKTMMEYHLMPGKFPVDLPQKQVIFGDRFAENQKKLQQPFVLEEQRQPVDMYHVRPKEPIPSFSGYGSNLDHSRESFRSLLFPTSSKPKASDLVFDETQQYTTLSSRPEDSAWRRL